MSDNYPTMHCQSEIIADTGYTGFLPDETLFRWFHDRYSTSKHLLTLYSIARGMNAKAIVEVGFGRYSFALAKAAHLNGGRFYTCDNRDFSYLLSEEEKEVTTYVHANSNKLWPQLTENGIDFAFLDYFSSESWGKDFVFNEFYNCFNLLKENGMICLHDTLVGKYALSEFVEELKTRRFGLLHNSDLEVISLPYNYGLGIVRRLKESPYGKVEDTFEKKDDGGEGTRGSQGTAGGAGK